MMSADRTASEAEDHPRENPDSKIADMALGVLVTTIAAVCALPAFEPAWVTAWAAILCGAYVAFGILPRVPTRGSEILKQCSLTVLWAAAILASMRFPAIAAKVALAGCFIHAWSGAKGNLSAFHSASSLVREHAARTDAETAFLQAVEEIRRLRIDVKTTTNARQQLTAALDESTSALNLVRGKADALAATLQRVMPYEPETGLLNAEKFETVLQREWLRMQRQELPLTLVAVKLDHFDEFEQGYGRMLYEAVMRRLAEVFRKAGSRPGDVAARLSRDQFVILFPEVEERHALLLAEAVRVRICQLSTPNRHAPQRLLTASLGVATIVPHADAIPGTLRERAEAALYEATFQGGNRCVRNRIAGFAKLERWNPDQDGSVTLDGLRHKLAISGYRGRPQELAPGAKPRERRVSVDSVEAVVAGILKVTLDGETRTLRAGDCLYLPKGVTATEEVVGTEPVVCIEGVRT